MTENSRLFGSRLEADTLQSEAESLSDGSVFAKSRQRRQSQPRRRRHMENLGINDQPKVFQVSRSESVFSVGCGPRMPNWSRVPFNRDCGNVALQRSRDGARMSAASLD
jgi:hypothetical protein